MFSAGAKNFSPPASSWLLTWSSLIHTFFSICPIKKKFFLQPYCRNT